MELLDLVLSFLVDLLEAAAWPAALVFAVVHLRDEIGGLIRRLISDRLTRVDTPLGSAEFGLLDRQQDADAESEDAVEAAERALPEATGRLRGIIEHARDRTQTPEQAIELLALQLYYERVYRPIYRSQMELLAFARSADGRVQDFEVEYFYGRHEDGAGEYALDRDAWLAYLYRTGLVEGDPGEDGLALTQLGVWFLAYCRALGYRTEVRVW